MTPPGTPPPSPLAARPKDGWERVGRLAAVLAAGLALGWACWPTLVTFVHIWATNPQYSHGFLVPVFATYLLWHRRKLFASDRRDRPWVGVLLFVFGCGLKLAGGYFAFAYPDRVSVVFLIAGVFGTLGGWPALRWAWPALAYLLFMVPLYGRVEYFLSGPLQRFATVVSAAVLQTLGFFAQPDGTVLILSEADLGIVEACSGLRMLLSFVALSTAVAILIRRSVWQKVVVILAAVPIALVCNVGRIVVTAIVMETAGRKWADLVFHDLAGWLMMPAGLLMLWAVLAFCKRLFVASAPGGGAGGVPPLPRGGGKPG